MLKVLVILAVLLPVTQTPAPVSGKPPDDRRHQNRANERESDGAAGPSRELSPAHDQIQSDPPQDETKHSATANNQGSVSITEYRTVPSEHTWFDDASLAVGAVTAIGAVA